MLWQRVVTAIALLLVLLPAMFYPSAVPLTALAIVFIAAAVWEWARLVGYGGAVPWLCAVACASACAMAWATGMLLQPVVWLWSLMAALWMIGGACSFTVVLVLVPFAAGRASGLWLHGAFRGLGSIGTGAARWRQLCVIDHGLGLGG